VLEERIVSLVERGRAAFAARAWADAYEAFSAAAREVALGAEDVERQAHSAGLLARDAEMLVLLEGAHDLYLASNRLERAAQAGFWIGFRLASLGEIGRSSGWLEQSRKLIARLDTPSRVEGYLLLPVVHRHLAGGELDEAAKVAARAAEIGGRLADPDLEALAQSLLGRALLRQGEIERGLAVLDLGMITASRDTVSPLATGLVYCTAIADCARIFALDRAREWTQALARFCSAQPQLVTFSGTCLVHCSEVHQASGDWEEAEREARRACDELPSYVPVHAGPLGSALYQRAELKRLVGDFDEAEALYREASDKGREPHPGLALLRLAQGKRDAAAVAMRRVLAAASGGQRLPLLPAAVEVLLAVRALDEVRPLVVELEEATRAHSGDVLRAMAAHARGSLHLAEGNAASALAPLRTAFEIWQSVGAPYLGARIRVELGEACEALGDADGTELERAGARAVFESLGAKHDLECLAAQRRSWTGSGVPGGLTTREVEVLRLVASGITNRQIAAKLCLSEKTVDRHLSNIFGKLNVASRAAATAYAYQNGLV
jgi:DNA-binding NarL/FixJ family response regulator